MPTAEPPRRRRPKSAAVTVAAPAELISPSELGDAARRAAEEIVVAGQAENTVRSYRSALRYWCAWAQARYGQPLALPVSAEVGGPGLAAQAQGGSVAATAELEAPSSAPASRAPAWMSSAKQLGEAQAETLKTVGELVDDNPKQAATIVRDWLGQAA